MMKPEGNELAAQIPPPGRHMSSAVWRRIPTALILFGFGLSLFLITLPADLRNNADTIDRFLVTRALVDHQTTQVVCGVAPHDKRIVLGRHNCYYAIYAPGQSILMAPLYVAGKVVSNVTGLDQRFAKQVLARMLDPILGAIMLVFFYLLALEVGYRRRTALALTLLLTIGTTVLPDVQSGQEQIQSTLALVAAVFASLRAMHAFQSRKATADRWAFEPARKWLLVSGLAAGLGIFTRYDFIIDIVALFLLLGWMFRPEGFRLSEMRRVTLPALVSFAIGVIPFVLLDGLWNTIRFGAPWKVGQSEAAQFGFAVWKGVPNLLVSPAKGLIWYVPLLWLLPIGIRAFHKRSPALTWFTLGLFVLALLFYGNLAYWHGDPAWGPRYLFPLVPLLILPLGELVERFASLRVTTRSLVLVVALLSVAVQLAAVTADPWRFWHQLIDHRQQEGQLFRWKPRTYDYYWTSDASLDPELYQFVGVKDMVASSMGASGHAIQPVTPPQPLCSRHGLPPSQADQCLADGVSQRPLNTVSPIWLNDRFSWFVSEPVSLSVTARALILGVLGIILAICAALLHLQFWAGDDDTSRVRPTTA